MVGSKRTSYVSEGDEGNTGKPVEGATGSDPTRPQTGCHIWLCLHPFLFPILSGMRSPP